MGAVITYHNSFVTKVLKLVDTVEGGNPLDLHTWLRVYIELIIPFVYS
jgi:hypothetical protein